MKIMEEMDKIKLFGVGWSKEDTIDGIAISIFHIITGEEYLYQIVDSDMRMLEVLPEMIIDLKKSGVL